MDRIFLIFLMLLFSTSLAAEQAEVSLGAKIIHSPRLVGNILKITPVAAMPFFNIFVAFSEHSASTPLEEHIEKENLKLQEKFIKENKEKYEKYIEIPLCKELYDKYEIDEMLLSDENFDYKYALLQKMNSIFTKKDLKKGVLEIRLKDILKLTNATTYQFFDIVLEKIKNEELTMDQFDILSYRDTNYFRKNLELITRELENGRYFQYLELYNPHKYNQDKYRTEYDFVDNYLTFVLLKENNFTDKQIGEIISLKPVELIDNWHTVLNLTAKPKQLKHRYKFEITKEFLAKSNIPEDKKHQKLFKKLSKTKMETVTHLPVINYVVNGTNTTITTPLSFAIIPGLIYIMPMGEIYKHTYKKWYNDVEYKEYLKKEKKNTSL